MRHSVRILTIAAVVAWCGIGGLLAEPKPEARPWLEKLAGLGDQKTFKVNYTAEVKGGAEGQMVEMSMHGTTTQADRNHLRVEISVKLNMGGDQQMDLGMLGVADGKTMWMEMQNPLLGGKHVMKMSVEQVGKAGAPGLGLGGGGSVDPVRQIQELARKFDLELGGVADGRVTLRAPLTKETMAGLGAVAADDKTPQEFVLVLDEKTAFPLEMRMGGDPPFMVMRFTGLEFIDRAKLDPATFSYTPPAGVEVTDLGAIGQQGAAAAPAAAGD